ncbi:hypothetical protein C8R45DRAFT_988282 [Mycena sanguinolenta]|nr:hypothetical protein C8R45DRAFT_988282 [Mycena sanguinolenta]
MEGHTAEVNSVAFSPNGEQIVSGSGDKDIRIWDITCCSETPTSAVSASTAESSSSIVSDPATHDMLIWERLSPQQLSHLWIPQTDGWLVVGGYPDIRLFWYPPELHHTLPTPPCVQISSTSSQTHLKLEHHSLGPTWHSITFPPEVISSGD